MNIKGKMKVLTDLAVLYLSMLSIRSKKIYVFGAWQGKKFSDNSKYLFLQAIKDESIKAIWITKDREIYRSMREKGYPVYMHNNVKGMYYQLRASTYFTCDRRGDISALLIGNATRINLYHGIGIKKVMHDIKPSAPVKASKAKRRYLARKLRNYPYRKEYVLSSSEAMTKIFSGAFRKTLDKMLEFGQPRNDVFFNDYLETEQLPFVKPGRKMILYMPTHRQGGKAVFDLKNVFDLPALNSFCETQGVVFVIKKHFYHRTEKENLSAYPNLIDITATEYDSQLLLKKADILISDYSSCYFDYLLVNKPIIFYNFDYENYVLNDRELYFNYEDVSPGPKVKDFTSLLRSLQESINGQDEAYRTERERVKNIFYSKDNQKSVGEKILQYVKENI